MRTASVYGDGGIWMRPNSCPTNQPPVMASRCTSVMGSEADSGRERRYRQKELRPGPAVCAHCWAAGLSTESNTSGE